MDEVSYMKDEMRALAFDQLEELETQAGLLRDAIEGASMVDLELLDPKLAEGVRWAITAGLIASAQNLASGIGDARKRLCNLCDGE